MSIQDAKVIDELFKFSEVSNWEGKLTEAELKSIEKGLKDLKEGRTISHETVMKKYDKHL